jgi:hypothetical protein
MPDNTAYPIDSRAVAEAIIARPAALRLLTGSISADAAAPRRSRTHAREFRSRSRTALAL